MTTTGGIGCSFAVLRFYNRIIFRFPRDLEKYIHTEACNKANLKDLNCDVLNNNLSKNYR